MKRIFLVGCFTLFTFLSFGQEFLKGKDLSQFKADQLSEAQLVQIGQELKANQMSLEQVEPLALAKGMALDEFMKFKARMQSLPQVATDVKTDAEDQVTGAGKTALLAQKNTSVFGSELFTSKSLSFEPNQNMPSPSNYILGPGDQMEIVIYGIQQFSFTGTVSKNGTLSIPNVGDVFLSGLTFSAAKVKLKKQLGNIYSTLASNTSKLSVSVSNYRTILVTIIGAQQSGNYRLSAMSSVYNALHVAGGPNDIGSYRNIELIRENRVIRTIDLYQFLTKGNQSDNIALEDNDVIRIPSYEARVVLEGEIKNPGIFEVLPNENLGTIISYASGFTENAYLNRILVKQKTTSELKVADLNTQSYAQYQVKAGDVITVDKILDRYENRIQIKGAVYRPGEYSLLPNEVLTLRDLIEKADGLKENVFLPKASLIRQKEDLTKEYLNINLAAVMQNDPAANLTLQKEDVFIVFYNQELLDSYKVTIDGEVRTPGAYAFAQGKTLYDLLLEADYFTDLAAGKVTVYRNKKAAGFDPNDTEKIQSFELDIDPKNPTQAETFLMEPMDRVVVRRIITFETPEIITLKGEVLYAGSYAILKKEERLTDFIARSGGFTDEADLNALKIRRNQLDIPLNWKSIQNNMKKEENIILEPGDVVVIPKKKQTVLVTGSVMFDTEIAYKKGKGLKYYLKNAGGTKDNGWLHKVYVVHANGSASASGSFLGIRNYPKVLPGSKIIIPEKPERKGASTGEIVGIASILTSLAGVLFAAFR